MRKPAVTDQPIHELARERWSPRAFSGDPLEEADLRAVLEAARWAPSSRNSQPWRFLVGRRGEEGFDRLLGCLVEWNRGWAHAAGALLVACARTRDAKGRPLSHARYDTGQAVAWLTVEAEARGLRVHQMGGFDGAAVRERCGLPDDVEPVTAIAVGAPGSAQDLAADYREQETAPREREPIDQIAFGATYGEAL